MFRRQDVHFALTASLCSQQLRCLLRTGTALSRRPAMRPRKSPPTRRPKVRKVGSLGASDGRYRTSGQTRAGLDHGRAASGRGVLTDRCGAVRFHGTAGGSIYAHRVEDRVRQPVVRPASPPSGGHPLQLADGQRLTGIDLRLPRGSVIAGHPRRVRRPTAGRERPGHALQYAQGNRQLVLRGQRADRRPGRVPRVGAQSRRLLRERRRTRFRLRRGGRGYRWRSSVADPGRPGRAEERGGARRRVRAVEESRGRFRPAVPRRARPTPNRWPTHLRSIRRAVGQEARPVTVGLGARSPRHQVRPCCSCERPASQDASLTVTARRHTSGNVNLLPDGQAGRGGPGETSARASQWDGSFSIANVPPGRYIVRARGDDTDLPQFAKQPLVRSPTPNDRI